MNCYIYRSRRKVGSYLYITEKNNFSDIPTELLKLLGQVEFVFQLELNKDKTLANADVKKVLQQLKDQGFFLQMPPPQDQED
jgi:uncharacterized protein YcgL (UPF0745 family)